MRAIVQEAFGAAEQLKLAEVPLPEPADGQFRIRVEAAAVHAVDTDIRRGEGPPSTPEPTLPMTPGREVAGVVDATGADIDGRLRGARVVAHLGFASGGSGSQLAELALSAGCTVVALYGGPAKRTVIEALSAAPADSAGRLIGADSLDPQWPARMREALAARATALAPTSSAARGSPAPMVLLDGVGRNRHRGTRVAQPGWARADDRLLQQVGAASGRR